MADDWPSIAEELGRKIMAVVTKYTTAYEASAITKREYFLQITALYDATSGLAPRDISDMLAAIHKDLTT
jgi:hypothetical protein